MVVNWAGPPAMISLFRKMYGSHSCPDIVRRNHFNNFQHYFLQKALVVAMSKQRNIHGICPPEILKFILDLFKYNDNSRNKVCCWDTDVICTALLLRLKYVVAVNMEAQIRDIFRMRFRAHYLFSALVFRQLLQSSPDRRGSCDDNSRHNNRHHHRVTVLLILKPSPCTKMF